MDDANDGRRALRIQTRYEALYSSGREEGSGTLVNVSYSGALIEETSMRPKVTCTVRLHVFLDPKCPLEIVGHVVRHTSKGFAVQFSNPDETVKQLVNDAAAVLGASA